MGKIIGIDLGTATQEFVVPKSIPIIFPIIVYLYFIIIRIQLLTLVRRSSIRLISSSAATDSVIRQ